MLQSERERVRASEITRPDCQAEEVCRGLKFSERHTVVSLVSTAPMAMLQELCAPVQLIADRTQHTYIYIIYRYVHIYIL